MRSSNDTYGGNDPLVDRLIGNAFPAVKAVAINLDQIKFLNENMGLVVDAANAINSLPAAIESQGSAAASATTALNEAVIATTQAELAIANAGTAVSQAAGAVAAAGAASVSADAAAASAAAAADASPVKTVAGQIGNVVLTSTDIQDLGALATATPGTGLIVNNGTVTVQQLAAMTIIGSYNAATNTPTIATAGTGAGAGQNNAYIVTTAGTVAVDSIGVVAVSDFIVNTGTRWIRSAFSSFYGDLATQNANNVNITGGKTQGQTSLGLSNSDALVPTIMPDLAYVIRDTPGNVAFGIGIDGVVYTSAFKIGVVDVGTALTTASTASAVALSAAQAAVAKTGDTMSGPLTLPALVLSTGDKTISGLTPDFVWSIGDTSGNIAVGVGSDGTLNAYSFKATTITIDTATITNLVTPSVSTSSVTVGGDTLRLASLTPDLYFMVRDTAGNIVSGYGGDGSFNVASLNVVGPITQNGGAIETSVVPSDCVDVRNVAYGAVGDGVEFYGPVTVTGGSTISITNYSGLITLAQTSSTTATVTIDAPAQSGIGFQPYDVNTKLYLDFGSYKLQAKIIQYITGNQALIQAGGVTPQSAVSGAAVWPSFDSSHVGKTLIIDGQAQGSTYSAFSTTQVVDPSFPAYGQAALAMQISSVVSPVSVTVNRVLPFAWTNMVGHMLWGTNDADAIAKAGQAAFDRGGAKIYFSGDGRLYLGSGLKSGSQINQISSVIPTNANAVLNGVKWEGDNVRTWVYDTAGFRIEKTAIPRGADTNRQTERAIFGRSTFRRCKNLSTINLTIIGDSQGTINPQNQAAGWMQVHKFVEEFKRANAGKTVKVTYLAIGGANWSSLANPTFTFTNSNTILDSFNIPRPVSGTVSYLDLVQDANRTGSGPSLAPDCVAAFVRNNDTRFVDGPALFSMLNTIKAISHGDGFGPTDVIMQTDNDSVYLVTTDGNTGGGPFPGNKQSFDFEYSAGLNRTVAATQGYGCLDLCSVVMATVYGIDPTRRAMRSVPSFSATASPTAPLALPMQVRDFSTWITLATSADIQMDISMSSNPGNRFMLRNGGNGNVWAGASTYGAAVDTTCTITSGGSVLTVSAPTTLNGISYTKKSGLKTLQVSPTSTFNSGMVGRCVVAPTGNLQGSTYQPQRNFITGFVDTQAVVLQDNAFWSQDIIAATGNISIGGAMFVPNDSVSQPDVVIFFADGTIWNTQVAAGGYISQTSATLVGTSPQALTAAVVKVFIGRMGMKWFDTGISTSGITSGDIIGIDVNRKSVFMSYKPITKQLKPIFDSFVERFGGVFYPVFMPLVSQTMTLTNVWIDEDKPIQVAATPWEIRGVRTFNQSYYLGGVSGHPSSRLRSDVVDVVYLNQDLSTS